MSMVNEARVGDRRRRAESNGKQEDCSAPIHFSNFVEFPAKKGKRPWRKGLAVQEIEARLRTLTGGWPRRVGNLLFAEGADHKPLWLETPPELFAWIARYVPSSGGFSGLVWGAGADMATEGRLHAYLTQTAPDHDSVEAYPHHPPLSRAYYMHAPAAGGNGDALAAFLGRFRPATPIDADLLRAFLLTIAWGGPAGARPAWLFTSDDQHGEGGRGAGKSTMAKLAARLVGGHIDLAPNERMPDLITRLLSPDALERRVVLLDNIKSLKLSWGELEALITNDTVSGHRLFHGEGRRPNTLTYCLTLNGASLSKDMAQRCVIVKLARPDYSATWEEETIALIEARRWEILGDLLAELRSGQRTPLSTVGRWGSWEGAVLTLVAEPTDCQRVTRERQEEVDDDASEADLVREFVRGELAELGHDADRECVFVPSKIAAEWCNAALGERRATPKASAYLKSLNVPGLRYKRRGNGNGYLWTGPKAPPNAPEQPLRERKAEEVFSN